MKRIYVVTGACGHLGNTIVRSLSAMGMQVRALALPGESAAMLEGLPGVELFRGNVCAPASLEPLFSHGPDEALAVLHTAAIISIERRVSPLLRSVNVGGVANIVAACLAHPPARLVHISSVHALPEAPGRGVLRECGAYSAAWVTGAYAKTKAEAAQLVLDAVHVRGLDASILLPAGLLGPGDYGHNYLNQTIRSCVTGKLRTLVRGGYNLVDVRDAAAACIAAVDKAAVGECYLLAGRHYEWTEVAAVLVPLSAGGGVRRFLSPAALLPLAPLLELWARLRRKQPLFTAYSLHCMRQNDNFSGDKARDTLGFTTRPMKETLRDTAAWELARAAEATSAPLPVRRQGKKRLAVPH